MVTLTSAENALKTVYLGVLANQLNVNANPLLAKIKQTTSDVWGKEIKKLAPYGINGGIGAGTETGDLPTAGANQYAAFTLSLKNLYGKIELSDKAIRASQNSAGAFVNLLNDEMEGLIKASSFNLGRMLYGDGTGLLATISEVDGTNSKKASCNTVKNMIEGMIIDVYASGTKVHTTRITYVNRSAKYILVADNLSNAGTNSTIYVQGSKDNEITGLGSLFSTSAATLYGLTKADYPWLSPYTKTSAGAISDTLIQTAIDFLEEASGSEINYIACSPQVRRAYQEYLGAYRRNIEVTELNGGFKAISYNGIPVVADRFVADDTMYLLNTNDFVLHQLCDWKWLESEDGKVLHQNAGKATYNATLVKYADLVCDRPNGQAKISGISSIITDPFDEVVTALETIAENQVANASGEETSGGGGGGA